MKTLLCIFLLAVYALTASAQTDLSGKWSGSFKITTADGESNEGTAIFVLKQKGTDVTGTVGPSETEQFPILKGKVDGDKITLQVDHDGHPIQLALVLAADHMKGDASIPMDGQEAKAKIDVTRVK
jgi:hypothetical protein